MKTEGEGHAMKREGMSRSETKRQSRMHDVFTLWRAVDVRSFDKGIVQHQAACVRLLIEVFKGE